MGRKTFESIPLKFRPLPNRRNLVLSNNPDYVADGAEVFHALGPALAVCGEGCFVIGGEATYRESLPFAQRVYATEVDAEVDGDAYFPDLPDGEWHVESESDPIADGEHVYRFKLYERSR
jgi:dihydrofolate reductase